VSYPPGGPFSDQPPSIPSDWQPAGYPPRTGSQTPLVLAIASLVTGVIGLLNCACCLLLPLPFISIVLGGIALTQKPDSSARVLAIIGIALSALILILFFGSMIYVALHPDSARAPLFPINAPRD
jgi:hypothetical protein